MILSFYNILEPNLNHYGQEKSTDSQASEDFVTHLSIGQLDSMVINIVRWDIIWSAVFAGFQTYKKHLH